MRILRLTLLAMLTLFPSHPYAGPSGGGVSGHVIVMQGRNPLSDAGSAILAMVVRDHHGERPRVVLLQQPGHNPPNRLRLISSRHHRNHTRPFS